MNYYEELGIRADAGVEDIRKAHRRLVKLMHPDHQRDPHMKLLAETQMRRLNTIVSTLVDPNQRAEYDEALRGRHSAQPVVVARAWRGVPWWLASTVAAAVLTVGALWIWADHLGSSPSRSTASGAPQETANASGNVVPAGLAKTVDRPNTTSVPVTAPKAQLPKIEPQKEAVKSTPSSVNQQTELAKTTTESVPANHASVDPVAIPEPVEHAGVDRAKSFQLPPGVLPVPLANQHPAAVMLPPAPKISTPPHVETASLSSPPLPVAIAPKPGSPPSGKPAASGNPLEGEWVYAPKEPEKHKAGFYPPEFIEFKLSQQHQGGLQGQYSARYAISGTNKPISPDVSFQVVATDEDARKFVWHSSNGSRGTLAVRAIDGRTIRIEWRTTVSSGHPALTSGIATLVRRP
jgi:curved DNA-binding protein CbpA